MVVRDVKPAAGLQPRGGVVKQRGCRDAPLGNGLRVEKRLERAAGLAQGGHAVHLCGLAQIAAAGADPGQRFARGVVQHQHGAVLHVAALQLAQVLAQGLQGQALGGAVQRAGHGRRGQAIGRGAGGLGNQAAGQVGGWSFAGGPSTAGQGASGQQLQRDAALPFFFGGLPGPHE